MRDYNIKLMGNIKLLIIFDNNGLFYHNFWDMYLFSKDNGKKVKKFCYYKD